jgi:hypothetical protein
MENREVFGELLAVDTASLLLAATSNEGATSGGDRGGAEIRLGSTGGSTEEDRNEEDDFDDFGAFWVVFVHSAEPLCFEVELFGLYEVRLGLTIV